MRARAPARFPAKGQWFAPAVIFLVGLAVSLSLCLYLRDAEQQRTREEILRRATARQALINESLQGYQECLATLRILYNSSDDVSAREFATAARDILQRYPGIQAMQWVPVVPRAERLRIEAQGKSQYGSAYAFTERTADGKLVPAGDRETYLPIFYTEPVAGNERALGYDLGVGPTRDELQKAARSGLPVLRSKVRLVQDSTSEGYGVVMACPVYQLDANGSPQVAPDKLRGYVQVIFHLNTMFDQTWRDYPKALLDILVIDATPGGTGDYLYSHRAQPYAPGGQPATAADFENAAYTADLPIGGRLWRFYYAPSTDWKKAQLGTTPFLVFMGGFFSTGLLARLVVVSRRRSEVIRSEVHERTAELRHTQNLLEADIAKRQTMEAELRESRRQLDSLLGQLPGMAFRFANDGNFSAVYISHGCNALTGHSAQELTSRQVRYDSLVLPEDRERSWATIAGSLADHRAYEVEYRLRDKSGQIKWVLDRGQGVYDVDGRLLFIEGLAIDITKGKQSEKEKLIIERKLLEGQKLESLGVLAGGIAHDFNNLLTGIVGNTSLVRLDLPPGSPLERNLKQIEAASLRASELCQQMLAYAGKGQFLVQRIDLEQLIRNTVPLLEHSISKRASLHFDFSPGLPAVNADATQIRQIVMNLVVNASDAIGDHDGVITVTTGVMPVSDPRLRQAVLVPTCLEPSGGLVFLQVNDTGAGMSAETMRKIFEPFFTTKFTGRGLGLAAVLGIVRSHQGGLIVESKIGRGTTFTLLLPACENPSEHRASRSPFPRSATRTGTVLIIDDEESVREVAAQMFTMFGMQPLTAVDGLDGLEIFRRQPDAIRLVILDLTMPRLSGEETLRELRKLSRTVPVIITSGYNRTTLTSPLASEPTVTFLQKPFSLQALLEQVDHLLG
jgi:PAS domain S-box-containing protein